MTAVGLGTQFGKVGALVGAFPLLALCTALTITAAGVSGLYFRFSMDASLSADFIPPGAPSIKEIESQHQFFNLTGEPWYMALFAVADQRRSVIEPDVFGAARAFFDQTTAMNLSVDGSRFNFMELCQPLCGINEQLIKLMDFSLFATLRWPVSEVLGFNVNIGKHLFKRSVDRESGELEGAQVAAFYYTAMQKDALDKQKLKLFEEEVARLAALYNAEADRPVELIAHGTNLVGKQVQEGIQQMANFYALGFFVSLLVFLLLTSLSAWSHDSFSVPRFVLAAFSAIFMPMGALATGLGALCWLGLRLNLLLVTAGLPAVLLLSHFHALLHVLGVFHAQQAEARRAQWTRAETIGALFEHVAPVHLTTNLVPVAALLAAAFWVDVGYAAFACGLGLALLVHWLYQVLILGAALSLSLPKSNRFYDQPMKKKVSTASGIAKAQSACFRLLIQPWATILRSAPGRVLALLLLGALVAFPLRWGLRAVRSDMDFRSIVPSDAPGVRGFQLVDTMWNDFHQIVFIVNKAPDFSSEAGYTKFRKFVADAENISNVHHSSAHQSWIFDYFPAQLRMDYNSENATMAPPNMTRFKDFVGGFPYEAWKDGVRFHYKDKEQQEPVIEKMVVMMAYEKVRGLRGKADLLHKCRQVARDNPELDVVSFDTDSRTVDIMDSVLPNFWRFAVCFHAAALLLTLVVLLNVVSAVLALCGVALSLATTLSLAVLTAHLHLDLQTSASVVAVACVVVRLALHFVGDFLLMWAHENRVERAIQSCGGLLLKTTLLGLLVAGVGVAVPVRLFQWQAALSVFGLGAALFADLVALPLLAGFVPTRLISQEVCI